jgi:hypothetical protein
LGSWTVVRHDARWQLFDGRPEQAAAEVRLARSQATAVLARGLSPSEAEAAFSLDGDERLAGRVAHAIAAMVGR